MTDWEDTIVGGLYVGPESFFGEALRKQKVWQ